MINQYKKRKKRKERHIWQYPNKKCSATYFSSGNFSTDMDLWVGLTNPGEDRCANETCLNFIAWDNDEREKVTEEEIFGRGIEFNNPTECIRIMIGVPMMDDLYCSSMFHFVCQREYQ